MEFGHLSETAARHGRPKAGASLIARVSAYRCALVWTDLAPIARAHLADYHLAITESTSGGLRGAHGRSSMTRSLRWAILIVSILGALLTLAYAWRFSLATSIWPWADSRLSYIFLSSILGANVGIGVWVWSTQDLSALKGVLLDAAVVALGVGATSLVVGVRDGSGKALGIGAAGVIVCPAIVFLLLKLLPRPVVDGRPTPGFLRGSFAFFTVALLFAVVALFLRAPHIFPWPLQPRSSVAFGWIFLGSAAFYGYATLRPSLSNAYPQMVAFLVYDLILIGPFLRQFSAVSVAHRLSLVLYTAVLISSGLLMIYYLAVDPETRIWRRVPWTAAAGEASRS